MKAQLFKLGVFDEETLDVVIVPICAHVEFVMAASNFFSFSEFYDHSDR